MPRGMPISFSIQTGAALVFGMQMRIWIVGISDCIVTGNRETDRHAGGIVDRNAVYLTEQFARILHVLLLDEVEKACRI